MKEEKIDLIKNTAFEIIKNFPVAQNGQNFLKLKNGKKLYFNIFIKKYGIKGNNTKYQNSDIARRIRLVEFFDNFIKKFDLKEDGKNKRNDLTFIIESNFYRMVMVETGYKIKKLELLSFYHYK